MTYLITQANYTIFIIYDYLLRQVVSEIDY